MTSSNEKHQSYTLFFPIRLWKHQTQDLYRFQAPRVLSDPGQEYTFDPVFWSSSYETQLTPVWKYFRDIWVLNPKYTYTLNRGFMCMAVLQQSTPPFATQTIEVATNENLLACDFCFVCYVYPFPGLSLLYVHQLQSPLTIVWCPNIDCPLEGAQRFPFLPSTNQDHEILPWYAIPTGGKNLFLYVFAEKRSSSISWEPTTEGICVPSNTQGGQTLLDCIARVSTSPRILRGFSYWQTNGHAYADACLTRPTDHSCSYRDPSTVLLVTSFFVLLLLLVLFPIRQHL